MMVAAREEGCLDRGADHRRGALGPGPARAAAGARRRPPTRRHAQFADERSDFLACLKLWEFFDEASAQKSPQAAQLCRENFLSYVRMREWRDLHAPAAAARSTSWTGSCRAPTDKPDGYRAIHRALLAGLLGNVGMKDEADGNYTGRARHQVLGASRARARRSPASGSWPRSWPRPRACTRAAWRRIDPSGSRSSARTCSSATANDPHWEKTRAQVVGARARHALRPAGVRRPARALRPARPGARARDLHPRGAGGGRVRDARAVLRATTAPDARDRAPRAQVAPPRHPGGRRADLRVLRRARSARASTTARSSSTGARRPSARNPKLLFLQREDLMRHEAAGITTDNFPHELELGAEPLRARLPLRAALAARRRDHDRAAGAAQPGPAARCEWLVPGLLKEKVRALAKSHAAAPAPQARAARRVRRRPSPRRRRPRTCRSPQALRALHPRRTQPRGAARRVPARFGAAAPAHEFPRASTSTAASWRWAATSPS